MAKTDVSMENEIKDPIIEISFNTLFFYLNKRPLVC